MHPEQSGSPHVQQNPLSPSPGIVCSCSRKSISENCGAASSRSCSSSGESLGADLVVPSFIHPRQTPASGRSLGAAQGFFSAARTGIPEPQRITPFWKHRDQQSWALRSPSADVQGSPTLKAANETRKGSDDNRAPKACFGLSSSTFSYLTTLLRSSDRRIR